MRELLGASAGNEWSGIHEFNSIHRFDSVRGIWLQRAQFDHGRFAGLWRHMNRRDHAPRILRCRHGENTGQIRRLGDVPNPNGGEREFAQFSALVRQLQKPLHVLEHRRAHGLAIGFSVASVLLGGFFGERGAESDQAREERKSDKSKFIDVHERMVVSGVAVPMTSRP